MAELPTLLILLMMLQHSEWGGALAPPTLANSTPMDTAQSVVCVCFFYVEIENSSSSMVLNETIITTNGGSI